MIDPGEKHPRCIICGVWDCVLCEKHARSCAVAGDHAPACGCADCVVYQRASEALRDAGVSKAVGALSEVLAAHAALALEPWQERRHGAVPVPSLAHLAPAVEVARGLVVWRDGELVPVTPSEVAPVLVCTEGAVAEGVARFELRGAGVLLPPPPRRLAPPESLGAMCSMLRGTPDARPCAARLLEGLEEEGVRVVLEEMRGATGKGGGYRSAARWVEAWLRHGPQAADAAWSTDCAACESSLAAEGRVCRLCREESAPLGERTTEEIILPPPQ